MHRIGTIPSQNLPISAISLQSRISSSPRGVTTSYFARNRLRVVCSISGLLSAAEGCPDNSLTPWPHRLSPRRDPRSDHLRARFSASLRHEIRRFLHKKYPCVNFGDFPHDFHWTARISDVETGYLQNRPTHGSCWVEWITLNSMKPSVGDWQWYDRGFWSGVSRLSSSLSLFCQTVIRTISSLDLSLL